MHLYINMKFCRVNWQIINNFKHHFSILNQSTCQKGAFPYFNDIVLFCKIYTVLIAISKFILWKKWPKIKYMPTSVKSSPNFCCIHEIKWKWPNYGWDFKDIKHIKHLSTVNNQQLKHNQQEHAPCHLNMSW